MIILPDYIIYTVTMKFTHNKHRTVREAPGCCPIFPQAFQLPKSLGFLWMFHHFPHLDRWMFAIFKSQGRPDFFSDSALATVSATRRQDAWQGQDMVCHMSKWFMAVGQNWVPQWLMLWVSLQGYEQIMAMYHFSYGLSKWFMAIVK